MSSPPNPKASRWTIDPQSPRTLGALLERMGADAQALPDGRVFVDRKRCKDLSLGLNLGQQVEVYAPSPKAAEQEPLVILVQRKGLIAVSKPAHLSTIADQRGQGASLQALLAAQLGCSVQKLHPTSRLDLGVSGVVLFATEPSAREALQKAREQGRYKRHYVALTAKAPKTEQGLIDVPIGRGAKPTARRVNGPEAVPCQTRYGLAKKLEQAAMLGVEPQTGRTHQIRVHLAHIGCPIWGDPLYGGGKTVVLPSGKVRALERIALHAAWVQVRLGEKEEAIEIKSPVPEELKGFWREMGGEETDWELGLRGLEGI